MLGSFTFVLHTHLPYVLHHGKWPFGSDWLSEAIAECYIPLLLALEELDKEGIAPRISMDFSPVNLEQLADPDNYKVFTDYCDEKILAAEKDIEYFKTNNEPNLIPIAEYWLEFYSNTKKLFVEKYKGDIIAEFRRLSDRGILDAMTCGATHGYFPLLLTDNNIRAQLKLAIATHEKHFGKRPRGVWLPECGYRPAYRWHPPVGLQYYKNQETDRLGVEELVAEVGLEYFVVDGALTRGGVTMAAYQPQTPHFERLFEASSHTSVIREIDPNRSLAEIYWVRSTEREFAAPAAFSRDAQTAAKVWSAEAGYPGNAPYLEFHKKHHNSGLRYWAVTGQGTALDKKIEYNPAAVDQQIQYDAQNFVWTLYSGLKDHYESFGTEGIVASPFDTELFGHWWFEGPKFIKKVCELLAKIDDIRLTSCAEALDHYSRERIQIALPEGSWGAGGNHFVWMNPEVAWMWDSIYPAEDRFAQILRTLEEKGNQQDTDDTLRELVLQTARELLLIEASDWEFLISTEGAIQYATDRFKEHVERFHQFAEMIDRYLLGVGLTDADRDTLAFATANDRPFGEIELGWWR